METREELSRLRVCSWDLRTKSECRFDSLSKPSKPFETFEDLQLHSRDSDVTTTLIVTWTQIDWDLTDEDGDRVGSRSLIQSL